MGLRCTSVINAFDEIDRTWATYTCHESCRMRVRGLSLLRAVAIGGTFWAVELLLLVYPRAAARPTFRGIGKSPPSTLTWEGGYKDGVRRARVA